MNYRPEFDRFPKSWKSFCLFWVIFGKFYFAVISFFNWFIVELNICSSMLLFFSLLIIHFQLLLQECLLYVSILSISSNDYREVCLRWTLRFGFLVEAFFEKIIFLNAKANQIMVQWFYAKHLSKKHGQGPHNYPRWWAWQR